MQKIIKNVFYRQKLIEEIDAESLTTVDLMNKFEGHCADYYVKDKRDVFYKGESVGADPETFTRKWKLYSDKDNFYHNGGILLFHDGSTIDVQTFRVVSHKKAEDKNYVYEYTPPGMGSASIAKYDKRTNERIDFINI